MIFSLIVFLLIAIVAYFHYMQGLFSAGLSAVMAVVAALVAVAYHEQVVDLLLKGKFPDHAYGITLVLLFALVYIILRVIFDKVVPGNVRFPVLVDKIGAALCGLVAGIFGIGVLVIAAQSLPFGPSIAQYQRYKVIFDKPAQVRVSDRNQIQDAVYDTLDDPEQFVSDQSTGLWIPADDLVLSLVRHVSDDSGSLARGYPFASIHPSYGQELFGQRVGLQSGSRHTSSPGGASVTAAFLGSAFPQQDQERLIKDDASIGVRGSKGVQAQGVKPLAAARKLQPGKALIVLRTTIGGREDADEKSGMVAFSPSAVRLVAGGKNFFPIGTLEDGKTLWVNEPDDFLFVPDGKSADLVFEVDEEAALTPRDPKNPTRQFASGVFLEFKRLARFPLEGVELKATVEPPGDEVEVVRKEGVPTRFAKPKEGEDTTAKDATLEVQQGPTVSDRLATPINVNSSNQDDEQPQSWGSYAMKARKFTRLKIDPSETIQRLGMGQQTVNQFDVPDGQKMVQLTARPASGSSDKWAWAAALADFKLVDANGTGYPAVGAIAKVTNSGGQAMLAAEYNMENPVAKIDATADMRPTEVTLLFLIPQNQQLKTLNYKDGVLKSVDLKVP